MPSIRCVLFACLALVFSLPICGQGQTPVIDSLKRELADHSDPAQQIDLLNALAKAYNLQNQDTAFYYLLLARSTAASTSYPKGEVFTLAMLSAHYLNQGSLDSARTSAERSLELAEQMENEPVILEAYSAMVSFHLATGNYQAGKEMAEHGIGKAKALDSKEDLAFFLVQAGVGEYFLGDLQRSLERYQEARTVFEALENAWGTNMCVVNIGVNFLQLGMMEEALDMFEQSMEIQLAHEMTNFIPSTHFNIAEAHLELGHAREAKSSYLACLTSAQEMEMPRLEGQAHNGLARYYYAQDSLDRSYHHARQSLELLEKLDFPQGVAETELTLAKLLLPRGEPREAIRYGGNAYRWAVETGNDNIAKEAAWILSESHTGLKQFEKALTYFKEFRTLEDSLLSKEKIRDAARLAAQYEFEKEQDSLALDQQRKDDLARAEYDQQVLFRNLSFVGLGIMALIVIGVVLAYRRIRQINANVSRQSQEISYLNQNLERLVAERTEELNQKNAQLADYIFTNSHRVRGPIARILGLLQLREAGQFSSAEEQAKLFDYIHRAANEADEVVFEISKKLESGE